MLSAIILMIPNAGCSSAVNGRVVGDVRIANGWISVDRCALKAVPGRGYVIGDCKTENYYLGKMAVPIDPHPSVPGK